MSSYTKECNVSQGFNVNPNVHKRYGYIEYLRMGDLELTPDISVNVPVAGAKSEHVGIISDLFWQDTAKVKPIAIDFRLSAANQQQLAHYVLQDNFNSNVLIEFATYDYDPNAHAFYSSFNTDKETIEGDLEVREDGKLSIYIAKEPETDVQSPLNYFVTLSIVPTAKEQRLVSVTSTTVKIALPWGLTVV